MTKNRKGRPPKRAEDRTDAKINVWVRQATLRRVAERAQKDGRSVSDWTRRLVEMTVGE